MRRVVKYELSVMLHKKEFIFALCAMMLYALLSFLKLGEILPLGGFDKSTAFAPVNMFIGADGSPYYIYFKYVFAFLVVLPYSMSYINDSETGVLPVLFTRCGKRRYIISKIIACFVGNVLIIAIPFIFSFLLCNIACPVQGNYDFGIMGLSSYIKTLSGSSVFINTPYTALPMLRLFLFSPNLYAIVITLIMSAASGAFGVFLLCLSFVLKRFRPFLFLPVYLLVIAGNYMNVAGYYNSLNTGSVYTDYQLMDYFVFSTMYGRNPFLILTLFAAMAVIGYFCVRIGARGDRMIISGGVRRGKAGKKHAS